jgi:hypothetical protein
MEPTRALILLFAALALAGYAWAHRRRARRATSPRAPEVATHDHDDDGPAAERRRFFTVGPGASGAVYDLLNEDKRRAIELIVEQRTADTDPERATGRPPSLDAGAARLGELTRQHHAARGR